MRVILVAGLLFGLSLVTAAEGGPCAASKQIVGECFTVHGRLNQSNGNPSFRMWVAGTHRMLGVVDWAGKDENPYALPQNVAKFGGPYVETPVFGDYDVCPLTKERPGWMQMVCIERATKLRHGKSD